MMGGIFSLMLVRNALAGRPDSDFQAEGQGSERSCQACRSSRRQVCRSCGGRVTGFRSRRCSSRSGHSANPESGAAHTDHSDHEIIRHYARAFHHNQSARIPRSWHTITSKCPPTPNHKNLLAAAGLSEFSSSRCSSSSCPIFSGTPPGSAAPSPTIKSPTLSPTAAIPAKSSTSSRNSKRASKKATLRPPLVSANGRPSQRSN